MLPISGEQTAHRIAVTLRNRSIIAMGEANKRTMDGILVF